jgi:hypothetical protein
MYMWKDGDFLGSDIAGTRVILHYESEGERGKYHRAPLRTLSAKTSSIYPEAK